MKNLKTVKNNYKFTYAILTDKLLKKLNFKDVGKCSFELFENMNYWVKNGVCLFYNTPVNTEWQDSYYVGYVEMRQGVYVAVGFRWINNLEDLTKIYESITNKKIEE